MLSCLNKQLHIRISKKNDQKGDCIKKMCIFVEIKRTFNFDSFSGYFQCKFYFILLSVRGRQAASHVQKMFYSARAGL